MSWTSLTAAQQDALLRRPFDHFARYRLAAEIISATVGPDAHVLDLGGGPGSLQAFMPDATVTSTDMFLPGKWHEQAPRLVLADGAALPFADDAFDVVVSMDTLEHVRPESRDAFLDETARVAGRWAFVLCPFGTPGVVDADTALREYVVNRFAPDMPTIRILDEHLGYGHPDLDGSRARLEPFGSVAVMPSGRIDRWFAGMIAFFHLLAIGDDEPVEVTQRFVNRAFYEADLAEPAYRHALLLRTGDDDATPEDIIGPLLQRATEHAHGDADLDLLRVVLQEALVASTAEARRDRAEALSRLEQVRTTALEAVQADRDAEVAALREQLDRVKGEAKTQREAHESAVARAEAAEAELDAVRGSRSFRVARTAAGAASRIIPGRRR